MLTFVEKTIFSKIIDGEIPSHKIAESEHAFAFLDISPGSQGHALVVSKVPAPTLHDLPAESLAGVMQLVQQVAGMVQRALKPDGINILQNNGSAAGQTVFHYHVHVLPRWSGDRALEFWTPSPTDHGALAKLAETIKSA